MILNGEGNLVRAESRALQRARAWQEQERQRRREAAALRQELLAEKRQHEQIRDAHATRVRELDEALRTLPADNAAIDAGESEPVGHVKPMRLPPEPSATQVVRFVVLTHSTGEGAPTPAQIVGEAHRLAPQFSPRALYNAIHRLTTIKQLDAFGERGERTYTITEKGRKAALEVFEPE